MQDYVLVAGPSLGLRHEASAEAFWHPSFTRRTESRPRCSSLLAAGFNTLWCEALNGKYTHFAMLHADTSAKRGWLDVLMDEAERVGADVISAVSPIKDLRGVTSCGIADPADAWCPLKRFTMAEIMSLPETFSAADAGYPGHALLVNTGCWVCDLRRPWVRQVAEDGTAVVSFTIRDRIVLDRAAMKFVSQVEPEDWYFSRLLHRLGRSVWATRKVELRHWGEMPYPNSGVWGRWAIDHETIVKHAPTTMVLQA